jgi:hypothetical protein
MTILWLKAEIVVKQGTSIVRQRRGKHFSAATNQRPAIEEMSEAVFYTWSDPTLCNDEEQEKLGIDNLSEIGVCD